jgi:hypothetical protein
LRTDADPASNRVAHWYHGSPQELTSIRAGSTITQDRELARIFSHKPPLVSQGYEGDDRQVKHSGVLPGFLYRIAEPLTQADIRPHPETTMGPGQEWLTNRELRVEMIEPTGVRPDEVLPPDEVERLTAGRPPGSDTE